MATKIPDQSYDTPNIPASTAVMISHSTVRIAAPASLVFRTLRNTETWKDWNKWVPRVNITYQPPDEDLATAAEINELVRNTSIAGSMNSDLTEGLGEGVQLPTRRPGEAENPPLKLRLKSDASRFSQRSNSEASDTIARPGSGPATGTSTPKSQSVPTTGLSGAQRYAMAQEARRSSLAAGETPAALTNHVSVSPIVAAPLTSGGPQARRKSKVDSAVSKAKAGALMQLYGEPSVRIQIGTKLTFFIRMNPSNQSEYRQLHMEVTEVSRPDDPIIEGPDLTALTRSKTHTLSRKPVYRVVWTIDHSQSSLSSIKAGSAFPKSLLQAERVHEIRPIYLGDGSEECEYRSWECQRGPLARVTKKKFGTYIQSQFEVWGKGLGEFCEALGGKVDRRDFTLERQAEMGELY